MFLFSNSENDLYPICQQHHSKVDRSHRRWVQYYTV